MFSSEIIFHNQQWGDTVSMIKHKERFSKWFVNLEVYSAKIATWVVACGRRPVLLITIMLTGGYVLKTGFQFEYALQKTGCILVAIALFFAFGEFVNRRMINETLPAIERHYAGNGFAQEHVLKLRAEASELESANTSILGWQFFIAIIGTLVWGFG